MTAASYSLLPHRSVIAVGGQDRAEFLQGLISNDTKKVGPGQPIWAALLTPQGRFLNDMFVVEDDAGTFLLETERERAPALAKKLKMYTLRSKVTVEDRSDAMEVAVVFGPGADKVVPVAGATAFVDPRLPELGVRVLAPVGQAARLLGLGEAPVTEYEALRLRLGVPDGSRDLRVEKALLLESGFDELHGVDWQKGCYMGQELTARTKYRGLIKRRLFPVKVEGALPPPGSPVERDGREVGEIRSGLGDRAIAMLQLEAARAPLSSAGAKIVAEVPDWMRLPESAG
ncbi:MAG: folate-binding protein YgfZ [Proteobacteria bacterium]|nr:folate-binding protein YgfZ [Pseudomonadota bacterium]